MAKQASPSSVVATGATPLSVVPGVTFQWNASTGVCHEATSHKLSEQPWFFQATGLPVTDSPLSPYWTTREICLVDGLSPQAIGWEREAARTTFSVAPVLLVHPRYSILPGITGELIWVPWSQQITALFSVVRPVLLIHTLHKDKAAQTEPLTIVPYFPASDPLLHHIMLLLQAAFRGKGVLEQLYTQSLADALAVHFLRRYSATQPPLGEITGGLSPYKLRRTTFYINAHLEQELSLATLAAVGETSPAHFSRLFKHATGLAPHQYVIRCRMERAKYLLAETNISLSEIALLVGCTDHSHFSALFRTHVAQTPTTYRDNARK